MVSTAATSLRDGLEARMRELEEAVEPVNQEAAARRPGEAEWCVKEVLSHLCGDEGDDAVAMLRRILDEDTPLIGIVRGLPYYTPTRQAMRLEELRNDVSKRYEGVAEFLGSLSDEQLNRKARVPLLKDTPIGEYPTLAQFVGAQINFHLPDHINQIRTAAQRVGG